MKTAFVVLVTVVALITNSSQMENAILQKRILECFAESKIPEDIQKKDLTGQLDNPKLKCFNACMMKKKGTMKDGKINPDVQSAKAQPDLYDMIKVVVNTCSDLANQESDECEMAYSYVKCLMQNAGAHKA